MLFGIVAFYGCVYLLCFSSVRVLGGRSNRFFSFDQVQWSEVDKEDEKRSQHV